MAQRVSDNDPDRLDIPSFIEPLPPLISNPFMRPKPVKATNLMELFEDELQYEESDLLQVYLRLKPCNMSSGLYEVRSKQCLITSTDMATAGHGRRTQHNVPKMYTFSNIFEAGASQKEIFENVVKDNLRKLLDGHSYTLMTYGASGSGKTYTLMGTVGAPGLVPRSLEYMFKVVEAAQHPLFKPSENGAEKLGRYQQEHELKWVKNLQNISAPLREKYRRMSTQLQSDFSAVDLTNRTNYYVWVSFVEIYNEGLYDLLVPCDRRSSSTLRIREDSSGVAYVKGASQAFVRSGEEAYDVMVAGKHNLQVAATGVHARSSRSHCIFTITLLTQTENGEVRSSCVRLCDLAGSERAGHTRNTGARMQESRAINSSLHVLERCLHTLRRKQKLTGSANLVPYRESKLTRLLGSGLSGARGEAVSMVVTINPDPKFVHETRHVLQLAAVAKDIQVNITAAYPEATYMDYTQDTTLQSSAELMRLRADNERLHFELMQAQCYAKELVCQINQNRQKSTLEKKELVNEAKASVKQYYESILAAAKERHRYEMEEIIEEYESKLRSYSEPTGGETPSRLQLVVAKLQKEKAVLEEKLNAEHLARVQAEEKLQQLITPTEEYSDESSLEPNQDDEVESLSDTDDDEDPLNESLEPKFSTKKKTLVVLHNLTQELDNIDERELSENDGTFENKDNTSIHDKTPEDSLDILNAAKLSVSQAQKPCSNDVNFNSCATYASIKSVQAITKFAVSEVSIDDKNVINDELEQIRKSINHEIGTYAVVDLDEIDSGCNLSKTNRESEEVTDFLIEEEDVESKKDSLVADDIVNMYRDLNENTDFLIKEVDDESKRESLIANEKVSISFEGKEISKKPTTPLSKLQHSSFRNTFESNVSLKQFEQCEKEVAGKVTLPMEQSSHELINMNLVKEKEKRMYFAYDKVEKAAAIREKEPIGEKVVSQENKAYFHNTSLANVGNRIAEEVLLSKSKSYDVDENSDKEGQDTIHKNVGEKKIDSVKSKSYLKEDSFGTKLSAIAKETSKCSKKEQSSENSKNATSPEQIPLSFGNINFVKEKRAYFDIPNVNLEINQTKVSDLKNKSFNQAGNVRSPSIVKDEMPNDYEPTTIKKLLGDSKTSDAKLLSAINNNLLSKVHQSIDLFDDPITPKSEAVETAKIVDVDTIQNSMTKISLVDTLKTQNETASYHVMKFPKKIDTALETNNPETTLEPNKFHNTEAEFENLVNNLTRSRATEFDLLLTQEINNTDFCEDITDDSMLRKTTEQEVKQDTNKTNIKEDVTTTVKKYNLRHKFDEPELAPNKSTVKTKRSLRLRRQKVIDKDVTVNPENPSEKLKDIANLQKEFSDVTMDIPVAVKIGQDIPSPEKKEEDENVAPLMESQSCPSKSVQRSRRKLFTPRAEPLDESVEQTGDSNEPARLHVPRPSYHKGRAKRKCQF